MTHPMAVTNCNIDMESLISDQNRSIATLAITTLLKTGNESSVDRLMKQITNFMSFSQGCLMQLAGHHLGNPYCKEKE